MLSHLAILAATVLWASSFAAGKFGIAAMPASEILLIRFAVAAAILWPIVLWRDKRFPWQGIGLPGLILGAMSPSLATLCFYWGMLTTSSINAVVIAAWMPLTTSLAAWALIGEKMSRAVVFGALIGLCGIVLLVSDDKGQASSLSGDALCVVGLLIMSVSQTYLRRVNRDHSNSLAITAWQITGGALMSLIVMVGFESWLDSRGWMAVPSLEMWLVIAYLIVFVSIATFLFNNYGLRRIGAGHSGLYYVLMAPLGAPISAIVLGESLSWSDVGAIALVAFGVAIPVLLPFAQRLVQPTAAPVKR